jgi:hypothetical protein
MAYRIFWQVPGQILYLELEGHLSLDDFNQINEAIIDHLGAEQNDRRIALLIDITRPGNVPQAVNQLRASQTYVGRRDLRFILVAGRNKLLRLMMLLTFNLYRPSLCFFDDVDQALMSAQRFTRTG